MAPFDPSLAMMVVVLLGMAVFSLTLGIYLLVTNPPKDRSKFVGLGSEKLGDEELESLQNNE